MGLAIVLGVRLTVPLTIFRWPLAGGLLAIAADAVDIIIFDVAGFPSFLSYQEIDKLLDGYYLAIEVIVAQRWLALPRMTASALFVYRIYLCFRTSTSSSSCPMRGCSAIGQLTC
jgi:hypothetical protein